MTRVPFQIPEVHGGLSEANGVLYVEDVYLVFAFQVTTLGFKQDSQTIKVERPVVQQMRLEHGLFTDRLYIVSKKLALLDALPGPHKGEVKLKISKRYRAEAEALIDEVLANV